MLHTKMGNRSVMLDSIRAVAIFMVLVFHVALEYKMSDLDFVAAWFLKYGFLGVDIFFPLSGFLITRFLTSHSGNSSIKTFFLRRFFRIIPLYFLAVTVYFIAAKITNHEIDISNRIWINYLFLTGWFIFIDGRSTVPYTITWSLSVEEFAYIVFGLVSWIIRSKFIVLLACFSVFPLVGRFFLNLQGHGDLYFFPPTRLDSIAIGGLTAVFVKRENYLLLALALLFFISSLASYYNSYAATALLYTKIALTTCFLIVIFETKLKLMQLSFFRIFGVIGFYSYYIYLFHYFNIYFFMTIMRRFEIIYVPFWLTVFVCFFATLIQSYFSFKYFEGPIMNFGKNLETRK